MKYYNKFPSWIQDVLHELISSNGIETIFRLVKEMDLTDCLPLVNAINKAQELV